MVVVDRFSKMPYFQLPHMHVRPRQLLISSSRMWLNSSDCQQALLVTKMLGLQACYGLACSDSQGVSCTFLWPTVLSLTGRLRMNALLEEYLRHFVSTRQKNWLDLLDIMQFCYNLHRSLALNQNLLEVASGYQPLTLQEVTLQGGGVKCPAAHRFARDRQELYVDTVDQLAKVTSQTNRYADLRRPLEFSFGEKVILMFKPQIWKKIRSTEVHRSLA